MFHVSLDDTAKGRDRQSPLHGRRQRPHPRAALPVAGLLAAILTGCGPKPVPPPPPAISDWSHHGQAGAQIRMENWLVRSTAPESFWMNELPLFLRPVYGKYREWLPFAQETDQPLTVYVFRNGPQWETFIEQLGGPMPNIDLLGRVGGYTHGTTSAVYVAAGPSDAVRAIGHQGMHQYLHLHGAAGLPAWIEEGLALMSEGYAPQGATYTLDPKFNQPRYERMRRIILEGRLLDLPTLLSQESFVEQPHADAAAQDWLAQVWALTAYLEDEGPYDVKFKAMLADIAAGIFADRVENYMERSAEPVAPGMAAFRLYITDDPATFWARFVAWAGRFLAITP